jgi:hypothetical protein
MPSSITKIYHLNVVAATSRALSINASGIFVDQNGAAVQLRGANIALFDSTIYSNQPANAQLWGPFAGQGGPPWPIYKSQFKFNCARITVNASAWLNVMISNFTSGSTAASPAWGASQIQADPNGVIKNGIRNAIQWCRLNGLYWIIDCHVSAPPFTFAGVTHFSGAWGQSMFMDVGCTLPFWTAGIGEGPGVTDAAGYASSGLPAQLLAWFGPGGPYHDPAIGGATGIEDGILELFNEPMLESQTLNFNTANLGAGTSMTSAQVMSDGGWVSGFYNQGLGNTGSIGGFPVGIPSSLYGASGQPNTTSDAFTFNWWWQAVGYKEVLTDMRAVGIKNVVQINGQGFASTFSTVHTFFPTDTLSPSQISIGWHPYQSGSSGFPQSLDPENGTANVLKHAEAFIAGAATYTIGANTYTGIGFKVPIIADETGTIGGSTLPSLDTYIQSMTQWSDGDTDSTKGTSFVGSFGMLMWNGLYNQPFGSTASVQWTMFIEGASYSINGSISTAVQSGYPPETGTLTVTGSPPPITIGDVITAGATDNNIFIGPQISGTLGGAGVYVCSFSQTVGSATFTVRQWLPINGEGKTFLDWASAHA